MRSVEFIVLIFRIIEYREWLHSEYSGIKSITVIALLRTHFKSQFNPINLMSNLINPRKCEINFNESGTLNHNYVCSVISHSVHKSCVQTITIINHPINCKVN